MIISNRIFLTTCQLFASQQGVWTRSDTENSLKINTVSLRNRENNLIVHVSNIAIKWQCILPVHAVTVGPRKAMFSFKRML